MSDHLGGFGVKVYFSLVYIITNESLHVYLNNCRVTETLLVKEFIDYAFFTIVWLFLYLQQLFMLRARILNGGIAKW